MKRLDLTGKTFVSPNHEAVTWTILRYARGGAWVCQEPTHGTTCHFYESDLCEWLADQERGKSLHMILAISANTRGQLRACDVDRVMEKAGELGVLEYFRAWCLSAPSFHMEGTRQALSEWQPEADFSLSN